MRIIAKATLREFWLRHAQAGTPLKKWYSMVDAATWHGPEDVKAAFGTAVDFVGDNRIIFDISGNKYRLVVRVSYEYGQVLVKFIGTHAEYDKIDVRSV
jgi:mRNA interferase HigB